MKGKNNPAETMEQYCNTCKKETSVYKLGKTKLCEECFTNPDGVLIEKGVKNAK